MGLYFFFYNLIFYLFNSLFRTTSICWRRLTRMSNIKSLRWIHWEINFSTLISVASTNRLFTKELELALLANEVDFIVHSLKDVPTTMSKLFVIGCVTDRTSCNDVVIMKKNSKYNTLSSLPELSVIGASSIRRTTQLKKKYPHLKFTSIRGNLNTRLLKLDDPEKAKGTGKGDVQSFDTIILAKAGVERLDWKHRISEELSYE